MSKLLVDDTRVLAASAKTDGWSVLRNGEDLPQWIAMHGWPDAIALDYDLELGGGIWDGARVAAWLRDEFADSGRKDFPLWDVHSRKSENNAEVARILAEFSDRRVPGLAPFAKSHRMHEHSE